jgi:hypothetical protein
MEIGEIDEKMASDWLTFSQVEHESLKIAGLGNGQHEPHSYG